VTDWSPRIAVVTFPGSNDDGDARLALERLGAEAVPVRHTATEFPPTTGGVVLPGGFSYGDYLRAGVLGICNGFQILCEARLLPGILRANRQLEFVCTDVTLTVEGAASPFTATCAPGDELVIPIKHGEGNWVADDELYAEVIARGQVALRYARDVNGSRERVAGLVNAEGNVLGLMPHPEHAVDPLLGPTGGVPILAGLIAAAGERLAFAG
jgi:phosphoribosylformylglycinamidine (FGAM) synthase-like amidotransferase family enzyme